MKINQNKSNHLLKKLYAKSFINNKNQVSNNNTSNNKSEKNNKKSITLSSFLKNSNTTHRNIKKYDLKCNTIRESYEIKNKINQSISKTNENITTFFQNNKKRSVILYGKNIKKEIENKINLNNKIIKVNTKDNLENKNIVAVGYNKTINHIRIKNPKLNSILCNSYQNKIIKRKPINICLPIRNYNSLNKSNNNINKSIRTNNNNSSFKEKYIYNNYFDKSKLKIRLKNNKSTERRYNFYKVDKKYYNDIQNEKHNLNRTIIHNYSYDKNKEDKSKQNEDDDEEISNNSNNISCFNDLREKENYYEKNMKKSNVDILKLNLDKIKNNLGNEPMTERENKRNRRDKTKNEKAKIYSKSMDKRNVYKKGYYSDNLKINKDKNSIKKFSDIAEKFAISKCKNNSKILKKKEKINAKSIKPININKSNKINENYYHTLPNNNLTNSEIFDININKKSYEIFEVISDVKVKSFIEYEEDKKNDNLLSKKESENSSKAEINSFKNKNIKEIDDISYDNIINNSNAKFIKDRDEYDIILKETFSKDRFSFRPTNKDSNETFQDTKVEHEKKLLDKKDFINNKIISSSSVKYNNLLKNSIKPKKKIKRMKNNNNLIKSKGKKHIVCKSKEKIYKK